MVNLDQYFGPSYISHILMWGIGASIAMLALAILVFRARMIPALLLAAVAGLIAAGWQAKMLFQKNEQQTQLYFEHRLYGEFEIELEPVDTVDRFGNPLTIFAPKAKMVRIVLPDSVRQHPEEAYQYYRTDTAFAAAGYRGLAEIPFNLVRSPDGEWTISAYAAYEQHMRQALRERGRNGAIPFELWFKRQVALLVVDVVNHQVLHEHVFGKGTARPLPKGIFTFEVWIPTPSVYQDERYKGTARDRRSFRHLIDPFGNPLDAERLNY